MKYNSAIHHRRSIRLKDYDYSQSGLYFVTICCKDKICHFGKIENEEMVLNDTGKMVMQCWLSIPEHFPHAVLYEYVIMPNHIHGIIQLTDGVGAKNYSPDNTNTKNLSPNNIDVIDTWAKDFSPLRGTSRTIGSIVRGFKIGITKYLGFSIWQRNYYEHIIRNSKSYQHIAGYIVNNPAKWKDDKFYYQEN
jgi:REP element-mobilizing transposase RayT